MPKNYDLTALEIRALEALELVGLYFTPSVVTSPRWKEITGKYEMSKEVLCDHVEKILDSVTTDRTT